MQFNKQRIMTALVMCIIILKYVDLQYNLFIPVFSLKIIMISRQADGNWHKFSLILTLHWIKLRIKFPCQIYAVVRIQNQQRQLTSQKDLNANINLTQFNITQQYQLKLLFGKITKRYAQKQISIVVYLKSSHGKIPAGSVSIILNGPVDGNKKSIYPIDKCPDKEASLEFTLRLNLIKTDDITVSKQKISKYDYLDRRIESNSIKSDYNFQNRTPKVTQTQRGSFKSPKIQFNDFYGSQVQKIPFRGEESNIYVSDVESESPKSLRKNNKKTINELTKEMKMQVELAKSQRRSNKQILKHEIFQNYEQKNNYTHFKSAIRQLEEQIKDKNNKIRELERDYVDMQKRFTQAELGLGQIKKHKYQLQKQNRKLDIELIQTRQQIKLLQQHSKDNQSKYTLQLNMSINEKNIINQKLLIQVTNLKRQNKEIQLINNQMKNRIELLDLQVHELKMQNIQYQKLSKQLENHKKAQSEFINNQNVIDELLLKNQNIQLTWSTLVNDLNIKIQELITKNQIFQNLCIEKDEEKKNMQLQIEDLKNNTTESANQKEYLHVQLTNLEQAHKQLGNQTKELKIQNKQLKNRLIKLQQQNNQLIQEINIKNQLDKKVSSRRNTLQEEMIGQKLDMQKIIIQLKSEKQIIQQKMMIKIQEVIQEKNYYETNVVQIQQQLNQLEQKLINERNQSHQQIKQYSQYKQIMQEELAKSQKLISYWQQCSNSHMQFNDTNTIQFNDLQKIDNLQNQIQVYIDNIQQFQTLSQSMTKLSNHRQIAHLNSIIALKNACLSCKHRIVSLITINSEDKKVLLKQLNCLERLIQNECNQIQKK